MARKSAVAPTETASVGVEKKSVRSTKLYSAYSDMETGNEWADSHKVNEIPNWYCTGSYALNGLISGDMTKGIPSNRCFMLAGETSTGKSFFARAAFARTLANDGYFIFVVDTENEYTDEAMQSFGIPKGQYRILKEDIVENVRFQLDNILRKHEERRKKYPDERIAIIIDSQAYLDTNGAREKTEGGKTTKDMTLQREIKALYKTIMLRAGILECPICIVNHVYAEITAMFPTTKVTGGQGGQLASSVILTLRKRPLTEKNGKDKDKIGILVMGKTFKSRITRDGLEAGIFLSYKHGMSKWYGVHNFAEEAGLIEKWGKLKHEKKNIICRVDEWKSSAEDFYVIKDPKLQPHEWIVAPINKLHSKQTIGTIFEEINEYLKESYKLGKPIDFDYDPVDPFEMESQSDTQLDDEDDEDMSSAYSDLVIDGSEVE